MKCEKCNTEMVVLREDAVNNKIITEYFCQQCTNKEIKTIEFNTTHSSNTNATIIKGRELITR